MKHKLVYILIALLLLTLFASSYGHVSTVFAQGPSCGSNSTVGSEGASCGFDGNSSGNSEDGGQSGGSGGNNTSGSAGSNNGDSNNNNADDGAVPCSPGTDIVDGSIVQQFDPSNFEGSTYSFTLPGGTVVDASGVPSGMCTVSSGQVDACTGGAVGPVSYDTDDVGISLIDCPSSYSTPPNPCNEFIVGGGGVTCTSDLSFWKSSSSSGSSWQIRAHAGWPGNEIHTRPYPVTLVDWDSVLRVAGLGTSSGADRLDYAAWGGGSEGSPAPGDWRDIVLRLEIRPVADWAEVFLENIGLTRLQIGHLYTFQWNLPSHPAAGGGPLSGQVGQLEELEPDVPLYSNWSRAPYMVYCTLSYYEWESRCVNGPGEDGSTNCRRDSNGNYTGHKEWSWRRHSQTIPIPPTAAHVDAPASLLADLNGDGVPDAYWGRLSFIRRMDDAGSVTNPQWAHSYSWGAWWYWAVREAQGQIGWPGVPIVP